MNILLVMTKRKESCIGFLKMLNKPKSLHCRYPEELNNTLHKCPYNDRLIQKLWDEQQKKKKKKRFTQTKLSPRLHNVERTTLVSMPGDYIMSTSVWCHFDVVCLLRLHKRVCNTSETLRKERINWMECCENVLWTDTKYTLYHGWLFVVSRN